MNNRITKCILYVMITVSLYFSLYYIFKSIDNSVEVTVKMKQTQQQDVTVYYTTNKYDSRNLNIVQNVKSTNEYQKVIFDIPLKYIYSMDIEFKSSVNEINNVNVESITVSSLFNKKKLNGFSDTNFNIVNSNRVQLDTNYVFSKFQVITKIKIICLCMSLILVIIFRNKINLLLKINLNTNNKLKILIFTSILFIVPLLELLIIDESFSSLKGGNLSQKPQIQSYRNIVDKSYMNNVENYLKDQIPYRDFMIEDYYAYNRLLQKNQFNSYYINKIDGEDNISLALNYSEDKVKENTKNIIKLNDFCKGKGIPFISIMAPNKASFYPEIFPNYMEDDSRKISSTFTNILSESNVENYDLFEIINKDIYEKGLPTHFRTDHHWTIESSFEAYKFILNLFDERNIRYENFDFNNFHSWIYKNFDIGSRGRAIAYGNRYFQEKDDFTVIYPSIETNYTMYKWTGEEIIEGNFLQILSNRYTTDLDPYANAYGIYNEIKNKKIINNQIDEDSTILVIGDSYMLPVSYFLTCNFRNLILLDPRYLQPGEVSKYIDENSENIDVILEVQYIETANGEGFFSFFE